MPPKALPLQSQQQQQQQQQQQGAPVTESLGMNPDFLLPHQRDQFRRHLQTITDLNNRKSTEPKNASQLEALITEARQQLTQLAAQASQNEKNYPTKEAFQTYSASIARTLQMQAQVQAQKGLARPGNMNELRARYQQISVKKKEIEETLGKPGVPEEQKTKLRNELMMYNGQIEQMREMTKNQGPMRNAAAAQAQGTTTQGGGTGGSQSDGTATGSPATPPLNQPGTPTVRNIPQAPSMQTSSSQPNVPAILSMGQLPRPSVNTSVPTPRATISGGYPAGNPILGTPAPGGVPGAFLLAQDGDSRLLSKRKLQDLVKSIDPDERLEPDVEEVSLLYVFVNNSY